MAFLHPKDVIQREEFIPSRSPRASPSALALMLSSLTLGSYLPTRPLPRYNLHAILCEVVNFILKQK